MTLSLLKAVQDRALALQYSVECGDQSLASLAKSIRMDETLNDHEIAARALAIVLIEGA